jgi:hypothetical protein
MGHVLPGGSSKARDHSGRASMGHELMGHVLPGGSSKARDHSGRASMGRASMGRASMGRASMGPDLSVLARAVRDLFAGPADQDRAGQVRVDTGPARAPADSDRRNRDRHAATRARSMAAGRLRDPSGETGSLPMGGRKGHRKLGALPAPARGRARSTPAAISRAGPAAVFDRALARRWVRAQATR